MIESIQNHTQLTFLPIKWSKSFKELELPNTSLGTWPNFVFVYERNPWNNSLDDLSVYEFLIDKVNDLGDFFPYNDREAEVTYFTSDEEVLQLHLEIQALEEYEDYDEVTISWFPIDDKAILIINHDGGYLSDVLKEIPTFQPVKREKIVLGNG